MYYYDVILRALDLFDARVNKYIKYDTLTYYSDKEYTQEEFDVIVSNILTSPKELTCTEIKNMLDEEMSLRGFKVKPILNIRCKSVHGAW